jgi:hypothetical protein
MQLFPQLSRYIKCMTYVNNAIHQLIHQLETRPLGSSPLGSTAFGKTESTNFTGAIQKKYTPATKFSELTKDKYPHISFSRLSRQGVHHV